MSRGVIIADDGTTTTIQGAPGSRSTSGSSLTTISLAVVAGHLIATMMYLIM